MRLLDMNPADMDWGQLEEASKSVADLYNKGKITLEEKRRRQGRYREWQIQRELEMRERVQQKIREKRDQALLGLLADPVVPIPEVAFDGIMNEIMAEDYGDYTQEDEETDDQT